MIRDTYDALEALLRSTGKQVYGAARVTDEDELIRDDYWLLAPTVPADLDESDRYTMAPTPDGTVDFDIDVKAVGRTRDVVLWMVDQLRERVVGQHLAVHGRANGVMRMEGGSVDLDRSVKPGLWVCDLGILFTSRKGP